MNREDIIRMAQETGVTAERVRDLVNFAALVASAERERLTDAAMKSAEKAVDVAIALEREACAEICKKHADVYALLEQNPHASGAGKLAWAACIDNRDTIRARG